MEDIKNITLLLQKILEVQHKRNKFTEAVLLQKKEFSDHGKLMMEGGANLLKILREYNE
ncbi:MAG TPA: hypothetical protein PK698_06540 [Bacilli bacterium]|nr:hypothetical protein [Bacilli bacterium]